MPRDNKSPLIQKIARKAYATFKGFKASANGDSKASFDIQGELVSLVTTLRAADLRIAPRKTKPGSKPDLGGPPVTYMHICETNVFSMGVFLLRHGASIPLHDHPGMHGMLKVLYGKVSIRSFDKLLEPTDETTPVNNQYPQFDPPLPAAPQSDSLRRSVLRSVGEFSADSGPCLLSPQRDNLHQIDAVEGPAAFLDILSPPYDPEDGRDCHYYKVLQPVSAEGTDSEMKQQEQQGEEGMWLLEIPQPEDFWCGGEPYPGPEVSI